MKAKVKIEQELTIASVFIDIAPRYIGDSEDDDLPTDFPLLNASKTEWRAMVDIDTGKILDWPQGEARDMHVKVCDNGSYSLYDSAGEKVAEIVNGYVPNELIPGAYGDYIELSINEDGVITNWPRSPDISAFFE